MQRHTPRCLHQVSRDAVQLKFHRSVHDSHVAKMQYDVEFILSPIMISKRHKVIDQAMENVLLRSFLLCDIPTDFLPCPPILPPGPTWRDNRLNQEQKQAVMEVVQRPPNVPPFIIFGPPGTPTSSLRYSNLTLPGTPTPLS